MRTNSKKLILVIVIFVLTLCSYNTKAYAKTEEEFLIEEIQNNENAVKLWNYIIEKGGSELWAATTVGNSYQESQLDTDLDSHGGYYFGAFQIANEFKEDYLEFCYINGYNSSSIIAQYEFMITEVRGGRCLACDCSQFCGLTTNELETDTTYITDYRSAAAYFALGMEGCVCWSGVTEGVGKINDKDWHNDSCSSYHFENDTYGTVCLQHLEDRTYYTELTYRAFHNDVEAESVENEDGYISQSAQYTTTPTTTDDEASTSDKEPKNPIKRLLMVWKHDEDNTDIVGSIDDDDDDTTKILDLNFL